MKKLILILTLCTFTSLTVATPIAAAQVTPCPNNTKTVTITNNAGNIDVNEILSNLTGKPISASELIKSAGNNNVKVVKVTKETKKITKAKKAKTKKKSVKNKKKVTTKKPVTTTTPVKATPTKAPVKATPTTAPVKATPTKAPVNATPTTTPVKTTPAPVKVTPTPVKTTPTTTTSSYSAFQKRVVELVNKERAAAGLSPLTQNASLDKVATIKSEDMAKLGYFDHTSPTYGSPFEMLKQFGVSYTAAGENIAYGQSSPEEVMNGWMNSPGHRANILNANYTQIGVGIAKKANGQLVWTQMFRRP